MTSPRLIGTCAIALCALCAAQADDFLDRLGDALTLTAYEDSIRARIRGSLDIETLYTPEPRADLLFDEREFLVNPRLSLFLDAQAGERLYAFVQTRIDRGFDPADRHMRVRLDEFALRATILDRGKLHLQAGKFATVVGAWSARHQSWENPFVTAPLVFENLTAMWDGSPMTSVTQLLRRAHVVPDSGGTGIASDKHRRLPVIWGPVYAPGIAVAGALGKFEYAFEAKNAPLSSRPGSWDIDDRPWGRPTIGGRLGVRPDERWNLGLSAARGAYLTRGASAILPPGANSRDYEQTVVSGDASFAHRHLQCWAECYASRFEMPGIGDADTLGYYLEAKYKFTAQLFGAVRWNQQTFSRIDRGGGERIRWGRETIRLDLAIIRRLTPHMQLKFQYSPLHERPAPDGFSHALAAQFTARF